MSTLEITGYACYLVSYLLSRLANLLKEAELEAAAVADPTFGLPSLLGSSSYAAPTRCLSPYVLGASMVASSVGCGILTYSWLRNYWKCLD